MTAADPRTPRTASDEERAAFKRSEHEAMRAIVAGDQLCPDPSVHRAEAAAAPNSLREALERLRERGFSFYQTADPCTDPTGTNELDAADFADELRAALAAPADKASEPPRAVELLRGLLAPFVTYWAHDDMCHWCSLIDGLGGSHDADCAWLRTHAFLQDSDSGADR